MWSFLKAKVTDEQRNTLLQDLNKVVLQEVRERLDKSLHHRIQLDLNRELQMHRVGRSDEPQHPQDPSERVGSRLFIPFSASADAARPIADTLSTRNLFERSDINKRLLILGEPGAGKTTELLALAQDLLQQAQQANGHPIPIIFELSAWSDEPHQPLANWFMAQLKDKYDVPVEVSKHWIENNQILPLLDGLDELWRVEDTDRAPSKKLDRQHQTPQIQCIRDINTYLDTHPQASIVVCCRRKEYEALQRQGEKLRSLKGAIYLQALSDKQIAAYFQQAECPHLWESLTEQPELLKLARSPLFLLMLVVAYQGQTIQSKEQLLDVYIDQQLADVGNQGAYPPGRSPTAAQTHHYLSWLALKLRENKTTEFLIEHLQPSWLDRQGDRLLYRLGVGLMHGLILGPIYGLNYGLNVEMGGGLIYGLSVGLILGVIFGLSSGLSDIRLIEKLTFSWQKARSGLILGLIFGVIFGLMHGLRGGLIGVLIFGLMYGLVYGLRGSELQIRDKKAPNQAFWHSLSSALIVGLSSGLLVGLIVGLIVPRLPVGLSSVWRGLLFGLFFGLLFGLMYGLLPVIQHVVLRAVLLSSGSSPRNYKLFMEHAENHRFIQRVGGRYRFVHDLLRTRFAERYQRQNRNTRS